jgi:hypothetical protein
VAQQVGTRARSGTYAVQLNAGGAAPQPLGPLLQLAVQKGDTVTVTAPGLYAQKVQRSFWFSLASFLTGLLQPRPSQPALPDGVRRGGLPLLQVGVAAGLVSVPQLSGGVPKGYVRLLVFDADSNLISQQTQQLSQAALNNYESLRLQVVVPQCLALHKHLSLPIKQPQPTSRQYFKILSAVSSFRLISKHHPLADHFFLAGLTTIKNGFQAINARSHGTCIWWPDAG